MEEIWKDIKGFEDYQISNYGRVKSKGRRVPRIRGKILHTRLIYEKILKGKPSTGKYLFVHLRKNKKSYPRQIHILVAEHFVEGKKPGLIVHHKDHVKANNFSYNLQYTSMQNNSQEYHKTQGRCLGSIPLNEVPSIIKRISNGEKSKDVAAEYKVTPNDISTLCKIIQQPT